MKLLLRVIAQGRYSSVGAEIEISEMQQKCFEPLRTADDPALAYINGERSAGSAEAKVVMKTRDDAAEIMAKEIARMLVREMKKNDTHNGYKNTGDHSDEAHR